MAFEERFAEAVGWMAQERHPDLCIAVVDSIGETSDTGCDTCGPEIKVEVWYRTYQNRNGYLSIDGSLSSLLTDIAKWPGWDE